METRVIELLEDLDSVKKIGTNGTQVRGTVTRIGAHVVCLGQDKTSSRSSLHRQLEVALERGEHFVYYCGSDPKEALSWTARLRRREEELCRVLIVSPLPKLHEERLAQALKKSDPHLRIVVWSRKIVECAHKFIFWPDDPFASIAAVKRVVDTLSTR